MQMQLIYNTYRILVSALFLFTSSSRVGVGAFNGDRPTTDEFHDVISTVCT